MSRGRARLAALGLALAALAGCSANGGVAAPSPSSQREDRGEVEAGELREISGIVASRRDPDLLWAHNDSGDAPRLAAMTTRGSHLGWYRLAGARHVDWEDVAIGPGPLADRDHLYVGDIGDNAAERPLVTVYRVAEPVVERSATPPEVTLTGVETIRLRYPDGPSDAETLLVDPRSGDLYVVTKRSTTVRVLRAAAPLSTSEPIVMERVGTLEIDPVPRLGRGGQGAVGGDVAPSGLAVLLKSYDAVWLWRREGPDAPLFGGPRVRLPYVPEPQGEAIAFAADGRSWFTVSEERDRIPARLYRTPLPADSLR